MHAHAVVNKNEQLRTINDAAPRNIILVYRSFMIYALGLSN